MKRKVLLLQNAFSIMRANTIRLMLALTMLSSVSLAQTVVMSFPGGIDNCSNPLPNAGTYTVTGTVNGKNEYTKPGGNPRIRWSGTQWQWQADDPTIGGINFITCWVNNNNTTLCPADCWASSFGCFIPIFTGAVTPMATLNSISRVGFNLAKSGSVNYTVTFSNLITGLTASNFTTVNTGTVGSSITSVTPGAGNTWTVTVSTTGDGTVGLNMINTTGSGALLCNSLPFSGQTYTINNTVAPVTLSAGDIAFTGYNSSSTTVDNFSFVVLRPGGLPIGTKIYFTDDGYGTIESGLRPGEGLMMWTATAAVAQFAQVTVNSNLSPISYSVTNGTATSTISNINLSNSGDQLFAYQGNMPSPTYIAGIHMNAETGVGSTSTSSSLTGWDNFTTGSAPFVISSGTSAIPPTLTNGTNAIMPVNNVSAPYLEFDNAIYNCTGATLATTVATLRASINDRDNWTKQDATPFTLPPSCTFSVVPSCIDPTVPTLGASSTTNCGTQSTTLNIVTGTLNDATNWQWYSGSCGGASAGSGTSIIVSPSVTTTYFARGVGGCVTPGACGSITINVNTPQNWYLDADNDGHYVIGPVAACSSPGAGYNITATQSGDCNDNNNAIYPGATEVLCNGIDENCNGMADDGAASTAATSASSDALYNEICLGSSVNLSANGGSLGTGASWKWYTGSCTGTLVGTGTTLNASPTSNTTYFVKADGTCNTTTCVQVSITVKTVPPASSVVVPPINNLPAHGCAGTFAANINVPVVPSASYYIWDGPTGTTFSGGFNPYTTQSPSADITFGAPSGSGYFIGVQAANACGVSLRKIQWVRNSVGTPAFIDPSVPGLTTYCPNSSATFTCTLVTGATNYGWTITGDATLVSSGNSVTVNFGPSWTTGTLCVTALTPCFTSVPKCLALGIAASTAYVPTGNFIACPNGAETYAVPAQAGIASYAWTLPPNASGSSSTNSVPVTFDAGFNGGNICVQATSLCGVALTQKCKSINSGVPTIVPSIAGLTSGLCSQTVVYTCPAQSGVTFDWTTPPGSTINSGQGTNAISVTFGIFATGTVCVTATNACGTSPARCITVKGRPLSPGVITAIPSAWCANTSGVEFVADVSTLTGSYTLSWIYPNASVATYVLGGGNSTSLILDWITGSGPVHVTASNACGNCTRTSTQGNSCREEEEEITPVTNEMEVYPNPTSGNVNIEFGSATKGNANVIVQDVSGRTIAMQSINVVEGLNKAQLDLSKVSKGIYMLNVNSTEGSRKIKIVVE